MSGERIVWACVGARPVDDRAGPVTASQEVSRPSLRGVAVLPEMLTPRSARFPAVAPGSSHRRRPTAAEHHDDAD
jgi:hypothetical protein